MEKKIKLEPKELDISLKILPIIWFHTFSPETTSSGVFMYQQLEYFKKAGCKIELIYIGGLMNIFKSIKFYFRYKNKFKSQIIHAQYGSGCGFLTSLLKSKMKILTLRGSDWYLIKVGSFSSKLHSRIAVHLTKKSLNRFDTIIVMSFRMKEEIIGFFPHLNNRILVIPDGINLSMFYPKVLNGGHKSNIQGNHSYKLLFSTINNKNALKGYDLAIEAYLIAKLTIKELEMVTMTNVEHSVVADFINECDLILLTSVHEGWPNIIKEGLACNVPFVSTDVSDLKLIAKKTNNCFVCRNDPFELAKNIIKSLTREKENLRMHVEQFEIQKNTDLIINIYQSI